jgi:hypothetical protein
MFLIKIKRIFHQLIFKNIWGLGIGDWGLGIGDWGLGPIPNPQSPIPNPHPHRFIIKFITKSFIK